MRVISKHNFEEQYIRLREKEGRLYTDDVVKNLPFISGKDPLFREWRLRQQSSERLINYLKSKNRALRILEVGSGNGWLANLMAAIPSTTVTGIDINRTELIQAQRVFTRANLRFLETDIRSFQFEMEKFDIIVFAASIQYFSSLQSVLNTAFHLLKPGGEIHILDTHFYKQKEQQSAQKRTSDYYDSLGMSALRMYYFHHTPDAFEKYKYKILYRPGFLNRFLKNQNPFKWYCIKS